MSRAAVVSVVEATSARLLTTHWHQNNFFCNLRMHPRLRVNTQNDCRKTLPSWERFPGFGPSFWGLRIDPRGDVTFFPFFWRFNCYFLAKVAIKKKEKKKTIHTWCKHKVTEFFLFLWQLRHTLTNWIVLAVTTIKKKEKNNSGKL